MCGYFYVLRIVSIDIFALLCGVSILSQTGLGVVMKNFFTVFSGALLTMFVMVGPIFAQSQQGVNASGGRAGGRGQVASVPEIDASTGLLAMAAVIATLLFVWERNRRKG
jgi:hypothetical protein